MGGEDFHEWLNAACRSKESRLAAPRGASTPPSRPSMRRSSRKFSDLARLGPYVHRIIMLTAIRLFLRTGRGALRLTAC